MKIITELCQNHNGDLEILEAMIKASANNSDILKIQSIKADTLTYREEYEKFRRYEDELEMESIAQPLSTEIKLP